jgi:hypothetical protein
MTKRYTCSFYHQSGILSELLLEDKFSTLHEAREKALTLNGCNVIDIWDTIFGRNAPTIFL